MSTQPEAKIPELSSYMEKLIDSINESCRVARNSINLMLAIALYMAALIFSVDHEVLFKDESQVIPQLGTGLKPSNFFAWMPLLFLFVYVMVLLQLRKIKEKVKQYNDQKKVKEDSLEQQSDDLDNLLSSFFFLPYLFGYKESLYGHINYIMVVFVIAGLPAGFFFLIIVTFFVYQDVVISSIQILALFPVFLMLLSFHCDDSLKNILKGHIWFIVPILGAFTAILTFMLFFGTFKFDLPNKTLLKEEPPAEILAAAYIADGHTKGENYKHALIEHAEGLNLRGRNFRNANLQSATLYNADFAKANLQGANLSDANLQGSQFFGTNLQGANLLGANLQKANLWNLDLSMTSLNFVRLQQAKLHLINLENADLRSAKLDGASLNAVSLYGADLSGARLIGAQLKNVLWNKKTNFSAAMYNSQEFGGYKPTVFPKEFDPKAQGMLDIIKILKYKNPLK